MLRILANDGMDQSAAELLKSMGHEIDLNHYDGEELVEQLKNSDVVVVRSATKMREGLIDSIEGGKLKLIVRAGVGVDNIDVDYAQSKGYTVKNTPNSSGIAVAELTLGHMFSVSRFIGDANVTMRQGKWNKKQYKGSEIYGKTLGLIGMGRISSEVAKRAQAMGMSIIYYDIFGEMERFPEYEYVAMDVLLEKSDYISLHVPYDKEKGPVLNAESFSKMKKGVYIINAARGGVVDENELLKALNDGRVAGAGIDVFEEEPSKNTELMNHPHVSCTPHIGAATKEAQQRIGVETVEVIKSYFKL